MHTIALLVFLFGCDGAGEGDKRGADTAAPTAVTSSGTLPCTPITGFPDDDRDAFGDPTRPLTDCTLPVGYVLDGSDCDDARSDVNPGAAEACKRHRRRL
ncbi:MAG: hypothetical protein ACI8PZ_003180 [Myxococcota bacterium]|jgi:hypothetical protein